MTSLSRGLGWSSVLYIHWVISALIAEISLMHHFWAMNFKLQREMSSIVVDCLLISTSCFVSLCHFTSHYATLNSSDSLCCRDQQRLKGNHTLRDRFWWFIPTERKFYNFLEPSVLELMLNNIRYTSSVVWNYAGNCFRRLSKQRRENDFLARFSFGMRPISWVFCKQEFLFFWHHEAEHAPSSKFPGMHTE